MKGNRLVKWLTGLAATVLLIVLGCVTVFAWDQVEVTTPAVNGSNSIEVGANQIMLVPYTVSSNGMLMVTSSASSDTYGYLYDSSKNQLTSDDDSGEGSNFKISYDVTPGKYYIGIRFYSTSNSGTIPYTVSFTKTKEGWNKVGDAGDYFYVKNGTMLKSTWEKIDGVYYYFGYDGMMYHDVVQYIDSGYYGFTHSGAMATGWFEYTQYSTTDRYYFKSTGAAVLGLSTIDGIEYYFNGNGRLLTNYSGVDESTFTIVETDGNGVVTSKTKLKTNGWTKSANGDYYYTEDGVLVTYDSRTISGYDYYFGSDGKMYKNQTRSVYNYETSSYDYYFYDGSGHLIKNDWGKYTSQYGDVYWYYADSEGKLLTGWQKIGEYWYYFSVSGSMYYGGYYNISDNEEASYYYFDASGHLKTGWIKVTNDDYYMGTYTAWYYADSSGKLAMGWTKIDGVYYYFGPEMYADTYYYIDGAYYRFDASGHMITGWYEEPGGNYCYYLSSGKAAVGAVTVGGVKYGFDPEGRLVYKGTVQDSKGIYLTDNEGKVIASAASTSDGWQKLDGKWYYVKDKAFVINQIITIDGVKYGFDYSGIMISDTVASVAGVYHGFKSNGAVATGWYQTKYGAWYYFDSDGNPVSGLQTISGTKYYFSSNGEMQVNYTEYSGGKLYVTDKSGKATVYSGSNGWINDEFYIVDGKPATGWKKISGSWYYFDASGHVYRDEFLTLDGKRYHFDTSKALSTGWFKISIYYSAYGYPWSYADSNGVMLQNGWKTSGSTKYYFEDYRAVTGFRYIDDGWYLFNSDGTFVKKATQANAWLKNDKDWFYYGSFSPFSYGDYEIDGKHYYFQDRRMMTDYVSSLYYYGSDGVRVASKWVKDINQINVWKYYGADGKRVTGWNKISGSWYYFDSYGEMVIGDREISGKLYHFDNNGIWDGKTGAYKTGWNLIDGNYYYYKSGMYTGLKSISGSKYYFYSDGSMAYDSLVNYHGEWYVAGSAGKILINSWYHHPVNGYWLYTDSNGRAVQGLQSIGGKKYYFGYPDSYAGSSNYYLRTYNMLTADQKEYYEIGNDGIISNIIKASSKSGWVKNSNGSYLYSKGGKFLTGYQQVGSDYYYFSSGIMTSDDIINGYGYFDGSGKLSKANGWVQMKYNANVWYYLADGTPLYGSRYIGGKWYYFNNLANTGMYQADGEYYQYNGPSGGRTKVTFKDGWNKIDGKYYYAQNGSPVRGEFLKIGSRYYYFASNGVMSSGDVFTSDGYGYYYLKANGTFLTDSWKEINGHWYYFDATGKARTGFWVIDGTEYTLRIYYGDTFY